MASTYSYACKDYAGMEVCPFHVVTEAEDEISKLMELHAAVAHGQDPGEWSGDDRQYIKTLMKSD